MNYRLIFFAKFTSVAVLCQLAHAEHFLVYQSLASFPQARSASSTTLPLAAMNQGVSTESYSFVPITEPTPTVSVIESPDPLTYVTQVSTVPVSPPVSAVATTASTCYQPVTTCCSPVTTCNAPIRTCATPMTTAYAPGPVARASYTPVVHAAPPTRGLFPFLGWRVRRMFGAPTPVPY